MRDDGDDGEGEGIIKRPASNEGAVLTLVARMNTPASRATMQASVLAVAKVVLGSRTVEMADAAAIPWHHLTYTQVVALRNRIVERYAPNTANLHLFTLRSLLRESWRLGLIDAAAWARLDGSIERAPGEREPAGRMLSLAEQRRVLDAASSRRGPQGPRDAALVALGLGAGLRRFELANIDADKLRREADGMTVVVPGKRSRLLSVPLPEWVAKYILAWLQVRGTQPPDSPLLCGLGRGPSLSTTGGVIQPEHRLSVSGVDAILRSLAEESGVPFKTHDLRRTYISQLWDLNLDAATVVRLTRHKNVQTAVKYDRRGIEKAREAVVKIPNPKE